MASAAARRKWDARVLEQKTASLILWCIGEKALRAARSASILETVHCRHRCKIGLNLWDIQEF
jgi:hypothetical protein